jgi:hypothetical protein
VWGRYEARLAARPLQTKMATSCSLMVAGDLIAQRLDPSSNPDTPWDAKRTASMGVCGLLMHAPWFHYVRSHNHCSMNTRRRCCRLWRQVEVFSHLSAPYQAGCTRLAAGAANVGTFSDAVVQVARQPVRGKVCPGDRDEAPLGPRFRRPCVRLSSALLHESGPHW